MLLRDVQADPEVPSKPANCRYEACLAGAWPPAPQALLCPPLLEHRVSSTTSHQVRKRLEPQGFTPALLGPRHNKLFGHTSGIDPRHRHAIILPAVLR